MSDNQISANQPRHAVNLVSLTLSRLQKRDVWVETSRANGFVFLQAVGADRFVNLDVDETALNELMKAGKVAVSVQTRLMFNENYLTPKPVEVIQKYWRAIGV